MYVTIFHRQVPPTKAWPGLLFERVLNKLQHVCTFVLNEIPLACISAALVQVHSDPAFRLLCIQDIKFACAQVPAHISIGWHALCFLFSEKTLEIVMCGYKRPEWSAMHGNKMDIPGTNSTSG